MTSGALSMAGNEDSLSGTANGSKDRLRGLDETAYIWRHPELTGVELFRGAYKRYQASRHFHSGPAIGIVSRGAMSSYVRGATHTLPQGTVFLINPGEVHAPGPALSDGWVLRAFYFSGDFYSGLARSLGLGELRFSQLFVRNRLLTQKLLSLHRNMEESGTKLDLETIILSVFEKIAQHYVEMPLMDRKPKAEHGKVKRAKEFLIDNHRHALTLKEIAAVVELSPYHLLRVFHSTVGLTPHDFLTQTRVEKAKRLLCLGNTISDTAMDTGFVDQAHFTRRFKAIVGVTPGQYRPRRISGARLAF
jgi:AraC-like DNA-binding protein